MEERHGQVRKKGTGEGRQSHARTQGRHAAQRRLGQEGQEPEAGDCDRPVRSAPRRREGAAEEDGSEEIRFKEVRIEEIGFEEIRFKEISIEEIRFKEISIEEIGDEEVGGEEVGIEEIGGEEIVRQEIRIEESCGEEEVRKEIGVVARRPCAIARGARGRRPSARAVCGPTPGAR